MDSQDVIVWGRPQPDKCFAERERIKVLCDWGRSFGLDGFVRMEFHLCVDPIVGCPTPMTDLPQRGYDMRFSGRYGSCQLPQSLT